MQMKMGDVETGDGVDVRGAVWVNDESEAVMLIQLVIWVWQHHSH